MARNTEQDKVLREQGKAMLVPTIEGMGGKQIGLHEYAYEVGGRIMKVKFTLASESDEPTENTVDALHDSYVENRTVVEANKAARTAAAEAKRQAALIAAAEKQAAKEAEAAKAEQDADETADADE